jgi:hypothetical protein
VCDKQSGEKSPKTLGLGNTHRHVSPCGGGGSVDTNQTMELHFLRVLGKRTLKWFRDYPKTVVSELSKFEAWFSEDAVHEGEEFAHDGDEANVVTFTSGAETFVEGF